jgi:stage II sporulation protein D
MKKRSLVIYMLIFSILLIGGIFLIPRIFPVPQKRAAEEFLSVLTDGGDYSNHIYRDLLEHPFLSLFEKGIALGYEVDKTQHFNKEQARVWVSILFPAGKVKTVLDMTKVNEKWIISELPETTFYTHGIPISKRSDDKDRIIWELDTGSQIIQAQQLPSMSITIGQPVCFYLIDGFLADFQPLQSVRLTRVMSLSNTVLEDRNLGYFTIQGDFPVFVEKGEQYTFAGYFNIPIGAANVTLYSTPDNKGRMAILSEELPKLLRYDKIRVILQNSEYSSLLHPEVEITCPDDFIVESVANAIYLQFQAGDTVRLKPSGNEIYIYKNGQALASSIFRWYISSEGAEPLYVKTIRRSHTSTPQGTPYRGSLEVAMVDEKLALVNEVDLEEYLYSVVPSEMPVKFGLEALKVQAVAARSYAARAMQASGYRAYGAHLDDSTASQVYNNIKEQEIAIHAVQDTAGMIVSYSNEIVDTRFFSTSCGYTANFHEVWSDQENEFPSKEIPYLTANPQYPGNAPDLYNEKNFRAFLDQTELPGYDRFSPFFRWNVVISRRQLEAILHNTLYDLYERQPLFVLTKASDGKYESREIPPDIGTLLNIEVLKRGKGGNIMELEITTTHGIFKIVKEYNIRLALRPVNYVDNEGQLELLCHDGTVRKDFPLLPSAFAYIDFERDNEGNILEIIIKGGGYGHGVGMSQYGTYGLTLIGRSWQQIIEHYYPGSQLISLYE